jgi:hypothetical protein
MTSRAVRAAPVALVAAVALAAAWLVPPIAIVVVWPLLLVLPGLAVLAVARPRIDAAGRLGLAVVISVAISAHLVYWVSRALGSYGRGSVFMAAGILAVAVAATLWRRGSVTRWRPAPATWAALAVAMLAAVVVGGTLGIGIWRPTATGVGSGGSNWSDIAVHLAIAQSVNAGGNFPPEVPYFAGVPLVYHWFADFHAAILAEAAGLFSIPAMVVQSTVLAAALALLVWSLARRLVRGRDARRVALLAAGLAIFGGGLGYTLLVRDVAAGAGSPLELVTKNSYDNQWLVGWPYFRIPSVLGTGLLAHRATTAGLPMLVGAVLLLVAGLPTAAQRARGWRDRPGVVALAGVVGALLAPFHFFFFPLVPVLAILWVVIGSRLLDRDAPRNGAAFLAPYALAIPFAIAPAIQASGSGAVRLVAGWQSAPLADGLAGVAFFYVTNLGLPFVLALAALAVPRLRSAAFLAAWLVLCFVIPNVVQFSVIDFDMNKYFQAMWVAVAILAGWLIRRWPAIAIAGALALSVPSPLLVAGWTALSNYQVQSSADLEAAAWIAAETPPDAVFVTDGWLHAPTDVAGRTRLTTFAPYVANLGYSPDARVADVLAIYCGGDADRSAALMRQYGATYLVDGPGRPDGCLGSVDFSASRHFELVHDAPVRVWRLTN